MIEKFKNFIYDISDFLVTIVVVFIVVASITFVMNKSFGFDFAKYGIMKTITGVETDTADTNDKDNTEEEAITPIKPKTENTDAATPSEPETNVAVQTPTAPSKPKPVEKKEITIEVVEGEFPTDIAQKLKDAGVIKDTSSFVQAITDGGYASLLQIGEYNFTTNMSDSEALKVLFP